MPTPRAEQHTKIMIEGVESTSRLLGTTGPTYEGKPVLTADQAEQAERVAETWFNANGYADLPTSYKPGHEGPMWVLSLEGYEDWAVRISSDDDVQWPAGVWVEPVTSWCLGLFPA